MSYESKAMAERTAVSKPSSVQDRWTMIAEDYDKYRPAPPQALLDIVIQLNRKARPSLIVDLGAGTGLSTRVWGAHADRVIGIEPSEAMRTIAVRTVVEGAVEYREAYAEATGLADSVADIVTASSALHWMNPETTYPEIARILRPGGIFAAYGHRNPIPLWCPSVEEVFYSIRAMHIDLEMQHQLGANQPRWAWQTSQAHLKAHAAFDDVRELRLHALRYWSVGRFMKWVLSNGQVQGLLRSGLSQSELGLHKLREYAADKLGDSAETPWLFEYQMIVARRKGPGGEIASSVTVRCAP